MKKCIALSVIIGVLFVMTGCGRAQGAGELRPEDYTSEDAVLTDAIESYTMATMPNITVYGSGNNKGFYEAFLNKDRSINLMYTDYETAAQVYLCSKPNCEHTDKTCTSWIAPYTGMVFPVAMDKKLAIVFCAMGDEEETEPSKIEIMNLDGSDRKELCVFPENYGLFVGAAASDESIVIRSTKTETSEEVIYQLLQINISSGEITELYSTTAADNELQKDFFLRGVCDYGFIVKTITTFPYEQSVNPEQAFENLRKATVHDILLLPYGNESEPIKLLSFTQDEVFEEPYKNSIVYLKDDDGVFSLHVLDIATQKESTLIHDFTATGLENTIQNRPFYDTFIYGFADNFVIINHLYESGYLENKSIENLYTQYAVDLSSGDMKEITLSNYYCATQLPLDILAQYPGHLLVHAVVEETDTECIRKMGILSVNDYINSEGNYRMIDQIKTVHTPKY